LTFQESQTLDALPTSEGHFDDTHILTHKLTQQLHIVRAHLLHYEELLENFKKSVIFILRNAHPGIAKPVSTNATDSSKPSNLHHTRTGLAPVEEERQPPERQDSEITLESNPYDDSDSESDDEPSSAWKEEAHDMAGSLLKNESLTLLNEIDRLEMTRRMLDKRLGNVMNLVNPSLRALLQHSSYPSRHSA
jgi:hypothetical protein